MFKQFQNKFQYAALAIPAFAEDINLQASGKNFAPLNTLTVTSIIGGAINLVLLVVALVFFFILIYGGLRWIMSEGDEKAVSAARNQITNALIGLAIVFAAFAIIKLIQVVFGVNIMNIQIPTFTGQ